MPRRGSLRPSSAVWALALLPTLLMLGCSQADPPPAPYEGHRPLEFLQVTQSFNPELQWVGGRVAAVGVNRGEVAALDSTLVWLRTAPGNDISSVVRIDDQLDWDLVESFGGQPSEALDDEEVYTFWLATDEAFQNALHVDHRNAYTFADTTATLRLVLRGRSGGGAGVEFHIYRDHTITDPRIIVEWTPADVRFRRLAIRRASSGGWTNLIWHLLTRAEQPPLIESPLIIGRPPEMLCDPPEGDEQVPCVTQVIAFPDEGFQPTAHILWAVTDDWNESFGLTAPGYAFFQIFASNFE